MSDSSWLETLIAFLENCEHAKTIFQHYPVRQTRESFKANTFRSWISKDLFTISICTSLEIFVETELQHQRASRGDISSISTQLYHLYQLVFIAFLSINFSLSICLCNIRLFQLLSICAAFTASLDWLAAPWMLWTLEMFRVASTALPASLEPWARPDHCLNPVWSNLEPVSMPQGRQTLR